ncbi:hypothetical protein [Microcoleus sp. herbarium14]|uniref:hypothetical protein n=1 Tax=Microcoleus sp. herbarium14 TaxID=3055439 RepID=UPI002FCF6BE9
MTIMVWSAEKGSCILFFKLMSNLGAIALINSLDDLMLSCGAFVQQENPRLV